MVANQTLNLFDQIRNLMEPEIDPNKIVVIRCVKAGWEYEMSIITQEKSYPFYEDATLMFLRDNLIRGGDEVRLVLLCDSGLDYRSCNEIQGFMPDKRKGALLHGVKCLLMIARDKLILERLLGEDNFFYLATIDGGEIQFHVKRKKLIMEFIRTLIA